MSLDVYLNAEQPQPREGGSGVFVRLDGATKEVSRDEYERLFPGRFTPGVLLGFKSLC